METRPVFNDQGEVVDFEVINHRQGSARMQTQDYLEQSDGSYRHVYQDVQLESDQQDVSSMNFQMDAYQQALVDSIPNLQDAIQWVEHSPDFTAEELQEYNTALDNQDLDAINRFYERLMPLYHKAMAESQESQQQPEPTDEEDLENINGNIEEWFDNLSDDFIDGVVDDLYEQNFTSEQVQIMDSLSAQYDDDSAHHDILEFGQQIAQGVMTLDDAIETLIASYGEAVTAAAYIELQHMITNYYE